MDLLVMGSGGFGVALAVMAHNQCGLSVRMWTPFAEEATMLRNKREHEKLLPGIRIPDAIEVTNDLGKLSGCRLAVIATPSFAVRETAVRLKGILPDGVPVACVSKGIESDTFKTHTAIIGEELPQNIPVIISGPSHAEEVARGIPSTVVAASRNRACAELVQDMLMNESLRIYTSDDVLGVELGGALKNVIALSAGVLDGLGVGGDNTRAALMTRGITEIARLGVALGAKSETFGGLSGIGDLIVTCSSAHSRNRRFGILIGRGNSVEESLREVGMTVEGYPCAKTAWELSRKSRVYMPIVTEAYEVLYLGKKPLDGIRDLMGRPKRHESESVWLLTRE